MRNDLGSLGPGRAAAQASHAANAFWHKYGNTKDAKVWAATTPQGFGTAIVLGTTLGEIQAKTATATIQKIPSELIIDTDYAITISPEVAYFIDEKASYDRMGEHIKIEPSEKDPGKLILHRQEITCAYIFGNKEELAPILGDLPLYS